MYMSILILNFSKVFLYKVKAAIIGGLLVYADNVGHFEYCP